MGSIFGGGGAESRSSISKAQRSLHKPLLDFFSGLDQSAVNDANLTMAADGSGIRQISDSLMGDLVRSLGGLNQFSSERGLSGTIGTRARSSLGMVRNRLNQNTESLMDSMIPQLIGLQLTGIGQREEARLRPAQSAINFATGQTKQVVSTGSGPGWGLLNDALVAGTMFAAGGFGGSSGLDPSDITGISGGQRNLGLALGL